MKISKNLLCEILIRDFSIKYLNLEEPFDLQDIMKLDITRFPSEISSDEIYTLSDIRYCMRELKLINSFSHIRIDEYKGIDSKEIISYNKIDGLKITLYDIIFSLPITGYHIKRCKNCGNYFITNNRNTSYCDRINKFGECCSVVGSSHLFQQKMEEDEALKLYTRAYKTHHARLRKKKMTQEDFYDWCSNAKRNLDKVRKGELDISIFKEWLKK